jgi:D-glycero-D-manno-heptose 1,7-bisphosphate phosphatase
MKLVILDRDGTINEDSDAYIKSPAEWRPIKGSLEAIARLTQADYRIVVATNQSGIARKYFDTRTLFAIHETLLRALAPLGGRIDAFFFCPHMADDACGCRKPRTGLLEEIAARFHTELKGVPLVGDSLKDLQCAEAVGAQPILVLTGKGKKTKETDALPRKTLVFADLAEAARHLISQPA